MIELKEYRDLADMFNSCNFKEQIQYLSNTNKLILSYDPCECTFKVLSKNPCIREELETEEIKFLFDTELNNQHIIMLLNLLNIYTVEHFNY